MVSCREWTLTLRAVYSVYLCVCVTFSRSVNDLEIQTQKHIVHFTALIWLLCSSGLFERYVHVNGCMAGENLLVSSLDWCVTLVVIRFDFCHVVCNDPWFLMQRARPALPQSSSTRRTMLIGIWAVCSGIWTGKLCHWDISHDFVPLNGFNCPPLVKRNGYNPI